MIAIIICMNKHILYDILYIIIIIIIIMIMMVVVHNRRQKYMTNSLFDIAANAIGVETYIY